MPVSQYEQDRLDRVAARAAKKAAGKKKPVKRKARTVLTPAQQEQKDIDAYRAGAKEVKDTRSLKSLTRYGKPDSTAVSGGSKATRKIDPKFKGKTTPARTGNDLVDKLRRKPYKYLK